MGKKTIASPSARRAGLTEDGVRAITKLSSRKAELSDNTEFSLEIMAPFIRVNEYDQHVGLIKSAGSSKRKRGGGLNFRAPIQATSLKQRRSFVKFSYRKSSSATPWKSHARYLSDHDTGGLAPREAAFSATEDKVDLLSTLDGWQRAGDPLVFSFIVSPEDSVDLRDHTRALMEVLSRDFRTDLEWAAVAHVEKDQPHVHITMRGIRDDGTNLRLSRDTIKKGIRARSQEILTKELGRRTSEEIYQSALKTLYSRRLTELDNELDRMAGASFEISPSKAFVRPSESKLQGLARKRLEFLSTLSLAERVGEDTWALRVDSLLRLAELKTKEDLLKHSGVRTKLSEDEGIKAADFSAGPIIGRLMEVSTEFSNNERLERLLVKDEFHEPKFLLIDKCDGSVAYLRAGARTIKDISEGRLKAGQVIKVERKEFSREGKSVPYTAVSRIRNWQKSSELLFYSGPKWDQGFGRQWNQAKLELDRKLIAAGLDPKDPQSLEQAMFLRIGSALSEFSTTSGGRNVVGGRVVRRTPNGFLLRDVRDGEFFFVPTTNRGQLKEAEKSCIVVRQYRDSGNKEKKLYAVGFEPKKCPSRANKNTEIDALLDLTAGHKPKLKGDLYEAMVIRSAEISRRGVRPGRGYGKRRRELFENSESTIERGRDE